MLSLLERHVASVERRLVVLAPPDVRVPGFFRRVEADRSKRVDMLAGIQRLRGAVYVEDGALQPEKLASDGRHRTAEDERAWHLATLSPSGDIAACIWYLEHRNARSIRDTRAKDCPLGQTSEWRDYLTKAVRAEMSNAKRSGVRFAEVGGWAVAPEHRGAGDGLILALAAFGLSLSLGGAIGFTTATVRHSSAAVLRRLGLAPMQAAGVTMPAYYDPNYQCEMELLRFDSRQPNPKYLKAVQMLRDGLESVPVFADWSPVAQGTALVGHATFEPSFAA